MFSRISFNRVALYIVLIFISLVYFIPVYMTVITALKPPAEISFLQAWSPPRILYWEGFKVAYRSLKQGLVNSLFLTIVGTIISVILGSLNGYVFSKWKFRGSEIAFILMVFGMFIPYQIILIPLFQTLRAMHLYGGIPGLIFAHAVYGLPITTLIFRNFYDQIPRALTESAQTDGASFFTLYRWVILPLSIPGFIVASVWQFTQIWNEFLWGVTLTKTVSHPITVNLAWLAGGQATEWNQPMAGAILTSLPVLLVFIFLGRYFIRGLLAGSVKG